VSNETEIQAQSDALPPLPKILFGRYELLDPIAKGGMAEVFKARLQASAGAEKVLCIKRILPHLSRSPDFVSLFVKEAKIALTLNHGNITQVFDFGEADGVYFLAMEFIEGRDLAQLLARVSDVGRSLEVPAVLHVAIEVAKGLGYAHSRLGPNGQPSPVVHRDVTPQNILISYTGEVKLADFGIAHAATKAEPGEVTLRGKICYLAPEQLSGDRGDPRSDLFSLGTVIYEMLTGFPPFRAETDLETLERIRSHDPEPPSWLRTDLPPELDGIVARALAKDQGARFQKAADLQVALTQVLHGKWPDYTAEKLSENLQDLFAWEIIRGRGDGSGTAKERLVEQLRGAGHAVDRSAPTAELLELGTVVLGGAQEGATKRPKRVGRGLALLSVLLLLFAGGVFAAVRFLPKGEPGAALDAGEQLVYTEPEILEAPIGKATPVLPAKEAKPAPPSEAEKTRARAAARRPGSPALLNCNSWPWSVVFLNGRRLRGNTPLYRIQVQAGRHQLRFENPELGLSREVFVSVAAGETRTVAVSLQP
jgi:hypothetical protein